jgi:uncharacterized protein
VIHVSLHDVSPLWSREIDDALALAREYNVRPSLLVVPNFHARAPLAEHGAFVDRVRALATDGHKVILHGFFHRADTMTNVFRQKVVSGGEAEFSALDRDQAARRLDQGLALFAELGLTTDAFIAPAWSFHPWLLELLRARGIRYTEDHFFTYDLAAMTRRPSLLLNYATRTHERLFTTTVFNRAASSIAQRVPTRVAIHPKDMHFLLLRRELERLLKLAV